MAPESERAKMTCKHCGGEIVPCDYGCTKSGYLHIFPHSHYCELSSSSNMKMAIPADPKPNEPTLTCSEVVERLAQCIDMAINLFADDKECRQEGTDAFDWIWQARHAAEDYREQSPAILHSWRERRVQELEEALRELYRLVEDGTLVRDITNDGDTATFLKQGTRITKILGLVNDALTKSAEWREQIRKGAKHDKL